MPAAKLSTGSSGKAVEDLHKALAQKGINVPAAETSAGKFGPGTAQAVQQFQKGAGLPVTGTVDAATAKALAGAAGVPPLVTGAGAGAASPATGAAPAPAGEVPAGTVVGGGIVGGSGAASGGAGAGGAGGGSVSAPYSVLGNISFDSGLPATGLALRAYNRGFAGADLKLGETKAGAQGAYAITYIPGSGTVNLEIRAVDSQGKETALSKVKYNAAMRETLNLVAPSNLQPLAPEFQRVSADLERFGGIAKLGQAQESGTRQDLTLLNRATNWDARLIALAATASQQAALSGLGPDVLYALYRVGLPSDPKQLALVPSDIVQKALAKANSSGIVSLNDQQIAATVKSFQAFAGKTQLALTAPGGVSTYGELLSSALPDATQQAAFAGLYFKNPSAGADLWAQAAQLQIPPASLNALKLQGKCFYLAGGSGAVAQKLQQDIGSLDNLSRMADKDYHQDSTWKTTLTALAGTGGDQALDKLIPTQYSGQSTADRLNAYSADLARKVRFSFPTQVTARMIENQELPVDPASAPKVSAFLRAAASKGYQLGRTPLNAFMKKAGLPAMDAASTESLKTVHRLYQVTPSDESFQAAMKLGFHSANDIASISYDKFMSKYSGAFPSLKEAAWVYWKSQQVSSVTFNFFSMAKQLDTAPPIYALSASSDDRQNAKKAIVQQFPTMAGLFGSLDYCDCEECRSVLSPAAYFVDLLQFLDSSPTNPTKPIEYTDSKGNKKSVTPLDVLMGNKDANITGRRPDLPALPLSCENTNTALPYIDLVDEIFEYFIAHKGLDSGAAYDTGSATTDDLAAEPQHIIPSVYNNDMKSAVYPLHLPFDLWIETVRAFYAYFRNPLAKALETLRPTDNLELFTDGHAYAYYRAQILAESLGISPAEYSVLTITDPGTGKPSKQNWFKLYGYADEPTALSELPSAKTLAQKLGLTYQELTDLVTTGFLNPSLFALTFEFERFGISLDDAFGYTGQPGYSAPGAAFEDSLNAITARYKQQNPSSTFDAKAWLKALLPVNYAQKVLVLHDVDTGCNFTNTTLQYANGGKATALDFLKLNLFVRSWKKLGWSMDETDRALQVFFPGNLPVWTDPNFDGAFSAAWKTALVDLAHLDELNTGLAPARGRNALLPLWTDLPAKGASPLYAQLFLMPGVVNGDFAVDDPAGAFPTPATDLSAGLKPFSSHQAAVQGVLGLTSNEVAAILADAGLDPATADFSLANISLCYRYSILAQCLQLSVADLIALKALSGLNPFTAVGSNPLSVLADDILYNQTLLFVKQSAMVQASGFTVEDLNYLLRHQFDPVGKYQSDPNALITLVQTVANGLALIASQNAVPPVGTPAPADVIESQLVGLIPSSMLKGILALLTGSKIYQFSQGSVPPANQIDPAPFAGETQLSLSYDVVTQVQTLTYQGWLLDWEKSALLQINNSALFMALLNGVQQQAQAGFNQAVDNLLSVWAGLAEYETVRTGMASGLDAGPLIQKDPAVSLSYDQADQLQWLAYRGVLTDAKKGVLTGGNNSADLLALLNDVQSQAMPTYKSMVGALLGMITNSQVYSSSQVAVAPANQIDSGAFFAALVAAQQAGTIPASVPGLQFSYDASSQVQTLTCRGVLADGLRAQLAGLIPASTVLANILTAVRNQAVQFFQTLASGALAVAAADLDPYSEPFIGADDAAQLRQVKARLVTVFAPLLVTKLSRKLVVDTLSANLASNPSFTESLVSDAGLLTDPNRPGKSLMASFLAVGQPGVSADYFASADRSGSPLASGTAQSADTADPTNPNAGHAGTGSAHLEGYFQVPTDGPFRFFTELGNTGATAQLRIDSPNPSALLQNPIIPSTTPAAKDHDELSQFVQLKGGVPYHFTVDFGHLGANGASLLVESETLPKGPMNQVTLIPQTAVGGFARANMLLSKVLQILQGTGIDERELAYLTAHTERFNNLKLSSLPTQASDDSPARAAALFSQFLTLADYADLRKGPAGGSDGLVSVFENVGVTFSEPVATSDSNKDLSNPWTSLANLTRRDPQAVRDVAKYLGMIQETVVGPNRQVTASGDFDNNQGLRRIWEVLQLAQILGIPLASLTASTVIASLAPPSGSPPPDVIAANLENAVKSRFTPDAWRPIAKSIFDPLRQMKRDALVSHLIQTLPAEDENQLFEYFLVDPGMEPVVQTSRLRLALSSVQTFVQRCLLNLESGSSNPALNILPSSIDANWWAWMKRYRVWEVNREIFLFPENWMIPELRMDKTDLFQNLESALLQGDVTQDLAEKAFYEYLKGLELRARLDIVAMYLDQDPAHLDVGTLYVLGRTYGVPHQYFYRTYANGSWSGWEAVTTEIDGDHIALVVWRGRLNIFWVTFIHQDAAPSIPSGDDSHPASGLGIDNLAGAISTLKALPQVKVQLHYTEYFQGKWSNPSSTDVKRYDPVKVFDGFDPNQHAFIHVSKETDSGGNEAVRIHLDFNLGGGNDIRAFRVTSKNCDPNFSSDYWQAGPSNPYTDHSTGIDATQMTGSNKLSSSVETNITNGGTGTYVPEDILGTVNDYDVLRCANPTAPPFLPQSDPEYWDAGSLVSPFFYKDTSVSNTSNQNNPLDQLTFFVQPSLTEKTIVEWEEWVVGPPQGEVAWNDLAWLDHVNVIAQVPQGGPVNPGDPEYSIYGIQSRADWATNPATAINYGNTWIGTGGGLSEEKLSGLAGVAAPSSGGLALARSQFAGRAAVSGAGLVFVSGAGVKRSQLQTMNALQPSGLAGGAAFRTALVNP